MKVLITGATGFLGRVLTRKFSDDGAEVFTFGKSKNSDLPNYFSVDIADEKSFPEKMPAIETIIHSAGLAHQFQGASREEFWRVNVEGTKNISEFAGRKKVKKFVLISSVAVYGDAVRKNLPDEEDAVCKPAGDYAESKFEAENICRKVLDKNIGLLILRPSTIIGEGDRGNVKRLIQAVDNKRFIKIGNGQNQKSLVYVKDVAEACRLVLKKDFRRQTEIFNVTAAPVVMSEILAEIEKSLDKKIPFPVIPPILPQSFLKIFGAAGIKKSLKLSQTIEKWLSDETFSGEKLKREIGFCPPTEISEAIRREVLHYQSNVMSQ